VKVNDQRTPLIWPEYLTIPVRMSTGKAELGGLHSHVRQIMRSMCAARSQGATRGDGRSAGGVEHGRYRLAGRVVDLDGPGCAGDGQGAALLVEKRPGLVAEPEDARLARADDEAPGAQAEEVLGRRPR
jgi:hypothetical protein